MSMEETEKGVDFDRNRTKNKGKKQQNPEEEEEEEGDWGYHQRAELDESPTIQRNIRVLLVGKRQGPSTPSPNWRFGFDSENPVHESVESVSARKLCARLWEIQPKLELPVPRRVRLNKLDQPANAGPSGMPDEVLRRQHNGSLGRNRGYMSRLPPATSPSSSSEVVPYKPVVAPSKPSHGLKTSKELLKVLNRIWSLEEQQTSNMSVMKALKMELDHSQAQIKGLLKEKGTYRRKADNFMEHVSESQHRKLAQELSEVKNRLSNSLKELERERKARFVLESLCDEFATGIKDYEQESRTVRHKLGRENPDRLILHISEAWLDERMQMKLSKPEKRTTVVDKLSNEIEAFLQASRVGRLQKENESRRESFPLNEAGSAPRARYGDLDSTDSEPARPRLTKPVRLIRSSSSTGGRKFRNVSSDVLGGLVRDCSLSSEGDRIHPVESHVKRWSSKLPSLDSEGSTLKEKLLEARLEGQKSKSSLLG